jgi:hypothetical protein
MTFLANETLGATARWDDNAALFAELSRQPSATTPEDPA